MVKVTCHEDCGNAPKKQYIFELLIASAGANIDTVMDMVTEDIRLELGGRSTYDGRGEVRKIIEEDGSRAKATELIIENILSHGNVCAANGIMIFDDGGKVAFNNMYAFDGFGKNARVRQIQVYSVVL